MPIHCWQDWSRQPPLAAVAPRLSVGAALARATEHVANAHPVFARFCKMKSFVRNSAAAAHAVSSTSIARLAMSNAKKNFASPKLTRNFKNLLECLVHGDIIDQNIQHLIKIVTYVVSIWILWGIFKDMKSHHEAFIVIFLLWTGCFEVCRKFMNAWRLLLQKEQTILKKHFNIEEMLSIL